MSDTTDQTKIWRDRAERLRKEAEMALSLSGDLKRGERLLGLAKLYLECAEDIESRQGSFAISPGWFEDTDLRLRRVERNVLYLLCALCLYGLPSAVDQVVRWLQ